MAESIAKSSLPTTGYLTITATVNPRKVGSYMTESIARSGLLITGLSCYNGHCKCPQGWELYDGECCPVRIYSLYGTLLLR